MKFTAFSTLRTWWQDRLFRGVLKNSGYLFSSNSLAAVLTFIQGIFAARLLGADGYGLVSGTVIAFASNVHRLLSFRMNEVVVKTFQQHLAEGRKDRAAAAVKGAALVEMLTSLVSLAVVLLAAPLAARYFAKDETTANLFSFYGLYLISNFAFETSSGVLQANGKFKRIAIVNFLQSVITASLIGAAFILKAGPFEVLGAYLVGKTFLGLTVTLLAFRELGIMLGTGWWRIPVQLEPNWREKFRFAVSTNLSGTVNLIVRDSETLLLGFFRSQTEVGYFRLGLGLINMIMTPIDPFIWPTYAEITRTIAVRQWKNTVGLLKKVSIISAVWTLGAGGFLIAFGWFFIPLVYGSEFFPVYPLLVILLLGYGFANIFQWNRPLLLALNMPAYPLKISGLIGAVKTLLTFTITPVFGYMAEAAILSGYFIVSIGFILRRGLGEMRSREAQEVPAAVVEQI